MYDDINETFWSVEGTHSLLPEGCAHEKGRYVTVIPGTPRRAYVYFRKLLRTAMDKGVVDSLRHYFHKTYYECVKRNRVLRLGIRMIPGARAGTG